MDAAEMHANGIVYYSPVQGGHPALLIRKHPMHSYPEYVGERDSLLLKHGEFNAYIGVRLDHPLAGKGYDDIDLSVHGGLTFAEEGDGKYFPKGVYWFGWDYAHYGDTPEKYPYEVVRAELFEAALRFEKLMAL